MRDTDEILAELKEKLEAISQDELKEHREIRSMFYDARDLLIESRKYYRMSSYIAEDGQHRDNLASAYSEIARALEEAADILRNRADSKMHLLSLANKTLTVQVQE